VIKELFVGAGAEEPVILQRTPNSKTLTAAIPEKRNLR